MQINVTEVSRIEKDGLELVFVTMDAGKHQAAVIVATGTSRYVRVTVKNAAHKAWRGLGKRFANLAAATDAYKTDAIRQMIATACELAAAPA
jgi:hypothetical protein